MNSPARTAGLRLGTAGELRSPGRNAAKIPLERSRQIAGCIPRSAETVEVDLMQDRRVRRDQFLALQAIDVEDWSRDPVEFIEAMFDCVQTANGTAVIILVVARQQLLGKTIEMRRLEGERHDPVQHRVLTGGIATTRTIRPNRK